MKKKEKKMSDYQTNASDNLYMCVLHLVVYFTAEEVINYFSIRESIILIKSESEFAQAKVKYQPQTPNGILP